ncbi:outer membrane assembly protein BamE, partial [Rhizobiaceae sp. 2RAB30]
MMRLSALLAVGVAAAACNASQTLNPSETLTQGFVMDQQLFDQVPVGSRGVLVLV